VKLTPHLSRAEVKNEWSHTSTPPICPRGMDWDNLKFVYPAKNICQIHLSWEQIGNYLLGSLYNAKLLPHVTCVTVVRHGVRTYLWASSS
jgi:hypothetical protein